MKALWSLLLWISLSAHWAQAQYVNAYAKVLAVSGNNLTLSTAPGEINETYDTFDNGDLIIIMQMQGNVLGNTTNTSAFGDPIAGLGSVGLYEVRQIVSQTYSPQRVLTLDAPPANTYQIDSNSSLQVITFRRLGNPNYTTTSNLAALPWNGNIGGVLAIDVPGTLTLAHNLTADGAGFRGGPNDDNTQSLWRNMPNPVCEDNVFYSNYPGVRAPKGEGIYKNTNPNYVAARGKLLNGGGGGNSHNGGGGGGGNYSAGGNGGWGWNCDQVNRSAGGLGGIALNGYTSINRVFMGGGGGAGERNNGFDSYGGNGGGIIILRAASVGTSGSCTSARLISANGNDAAPGNGWDGCGGGGAGGSIVLIVNNWNVPLSCPIHVSVNGGNGGNVNSSMHGGGGGGGQGVIFFTTPLPANVTTSTAPGIGGCNNNANPCDRAANGQNAGSSVFTSQFTPLPVELLGFRALALEYPKVRLEWAVAQPEEAAAFHIERSVDLQTWEEIGRLLSKPHQQYYSFYDTEASNRQIYYRLKVYRTSGEHFYSNVQFVDFGHVTAEVYLYPNPTTNKVFISSNRKLLKVWVCGIEGTLLADVPVRVEGHQAEVSLHSLANGFYLLYIQTENQLKIERVCLQK
ncbi:MAG: hypothetical protein KatS3mg033_1142 [Thermonema sp.]|uniref:T9SS type A sorting domain-containing protein n=1 Tax=Thermonema sp. TaxID=2231181 RepID=UPI0021DD2162|nr:T9SS type A sorting domain-containing protein [Thermonema sp.]GIV39342.1 MAG: hypothetical protein KatS3mg033_1142 [Thermonema sp.]